MTRFAKLLKQAGDRLQLDTFGGQPGGLALFTLAQLNGSRFFVKLLWGNFDAQGHFDLAGTIPPGVAGNDLDFQTLGIVPTGKGDLSNLELVLFR